MAEADSRRVLAETRLADETLFPITLPVSEDGRELPEESAALARELLEKSGLLSVGAALWGR